MRLEIQLACPAPAGSTQGNRVTALRWARLLRELGHRVRIAQELEGEPDLLVALHARRSARAASAFKKRWPDKPLVVALTGTDLYKDLPAGSRIAHRSLELADRLIVLHERAKQDLPRELRRKTRVLHQSVVLPKNLPRPKPGSFDVCVLSHLRSVKDPLRAALASRRLSAESRLRIRHLGRPLEKRLTQRAHAEMERNPRYRWLGERPHAAALRVLASCKLLVVSSKMEGGANVIGEAARLGVGILASDVPGNRGLLGGRHPGYFEYGDTAALTRLFARAETEPAFLARLRAASKQLAPRFSVANENRGWRELCSELRRGRAHG